MARCKGKKCRCKASHIVSDVVKCGEFPCYDVCSKPICGTPSVLSLMAPVIYDEIGINLCTTIDLDADYSELYPTADHISMSVMGITIPYGTGDNQVQVVPIAGRPNCYQVNLTNLDVDFVVRVYDCANRLLATVAQDATYLPSDPAEADEETNPTEVDLEIYAPYGPAYNTDAAPSAVLNVLGYGDAINQLQQGINLIAIPKVLDFNLEENTVTVGLTLLLQSVYYSAYKVPTYGRSFTPKGSIVPEDQSMCKEFVEGSLLDLNIRPLQLGPPRREEHLKQDCGDGDDCCCKLRTATENNDDANPLNDVNVDDTVDNDALLEALAAEN